MLRSEDFLSASSIAAWRCRHQCCWLCGTRRHCHRHREKHCRLRRHPRRQDPQHQGHSARHRRCLRAGGGLVYAPPGNWLFLGGLELRCRVTLYLEAGCVLLGSTRIEDYEYRTGLPRGGSDIDGYHVIFAREAEDITICGPGTIDGQGDSWWEPNPNVHPFPPEEQWHNVASGHVQAKYNNTRPSPMVELAAIACNVRITGVTLKNSAGWTLRPINCETVFIDGIRIRNPYYGRNTDGMDITSCRNVMVSNCDIIGGDDALCLKSENSYGSDVLPAPKTSPSRTAWSPVPATASKWARPLAAPSKTSLSPTAPSTPPTNDSSHDEPRHHRPQHRDCHRWRLG